MTDKYRGRRVSDVPTSVRIQGPFAGDRSEAENFVREAFLAAYAARIEHFLPTLMTLRNNGGRLLAVLGLRDPGCGRLFLEQYLDRPVEQLLSAATACQVERNELIEVGNFAVGSAGGGRWLITALTAYLHATGRRWAVFTCGPMLRNAFDRLGIELIDLAVADPGCLTPAESLGWGSYYNTKPRVMAANVSQSHAVLSALFEKECALSLLWLGALQAGRLAA
jgi:hypothetical protein